MSISPPNRKALALLILVFALGVAFGAVGTNLASQRVFGARTRAAAGQPSQAHAVTRMTNDLNLTADQQAKVTAILAQMQARYNAIHKTVVPEYDQARDDGRNQIRQVLTPEQLPKFEDFLRRVDEERHKRSAAR